MKNLSPFLIEDVKCIGYGTEATIYQFRADAGRVAKVPNPGYPLLERHLQHEFELGSLLSKEGISVPRMYGLASLLLPEHSRPALVMEYVPGVKVDDMKEMRAHAISLLIQEREKAYALGFFGTDLRRANGIYVPELDKVVLVDFISWKKEGHQCLGCPNK